jgi:large subunit ribosomal protein L22
MEAIAKLNNCPTSTRKMRLVVDNIRNLKVEKALAILTFTQKSAARDVHKLLRSAINNWEQKNNMKADEVELIVKTAYVNGGTQLKRISPAPMGRAYRIRKRSNHVTIIVDTKNENKA